MKRFVYCLWMIILCLFCVVPSLSSYSFHKVSAATSGMIGDDVKFSYSSSSKMLTIEGTGPIDGNAVFDAPWEAYQDEIELIVVKDGVTTLPDYTFMNLEKVRKVQLGSTVTSLGWYTFYDCIGLKEIFLPKSLKTITRGAFSGCKALESVSVSKYNNTYVAKDGILFTKDMKQLVLYPAGKKGTSYTIPNGVEEIFDCAFSGNQYLETLKMADSVRSLLSDACHSMKSLKKVTFNNQIKYLYSGAFSYCYELNNVVIPSSMISIGNDCFYANRSLEKLTLKGKKTDIGYFKTAYPTDTIICGYSGSKAQAYAKRTGKQFQDLSTGEMFNYVKDNQALMKSLPLNLEAAEPSYHGVHMTSFEGVFSGYQTFILHESDTTNQYYQEIKAKVNELCKGLNSDYKKAKAIANFVHDHIEYDLGHLGNSMGAIYRAWVNQIGNCESYTVLTNYMLYLAGIPTATITSAAHEWTGALIDGEWITIDATNGRFDVSPNDQPAINNISFTYKKGVYLMDGYEGIALAGIGYGYNDSRKEFKNYTIPSFATIVHGSAIDLTTEDFYAKGKKGTKAHQSAIDGGLCVTSDDTYFYAKAKHGASSVKTIKATPTKDGSNNVICSVCGEITKSTVIPKLSDITLSRTAYTYDGKSHKPSVTVRDSNGTLILPDYYDVTYSSGRTKVGKYNVTITFNSNNYKYSGSITKTFQIRPKKTTIHSLVSAKTKIKVNVNRRATQTSGYHIQYATNAKFENAKSKWISDPYKLSTYISSLKSNTKYYLRVRPYKNVKYNGETIKIYGTYSPVKTIKTK